MTTYPLSRIEFQATRELLRLGAGGEEGYLLGPPEEVRPLTSGRLAKLARVGAIELEEKEGGKLVRVTPLGVESARAAAIYFADIVKARKTEPTVPALYLWLTERAKQQAVPVEEVWMLVCRLFETRRRVSEETLKAAVTHAIERTKKR